MLLNKIFIVNLRTWHVSLARTRLANCVVRNANVRPEIGHRCVETDVAFSISRLGNLFQRVVVTLQRPNKIGLLRVRYRGAYHVIHPVYSFLFHVTLRLNCPQKKMVRFLRNHWSHNSYKCYITLSVKLYIYLLSINNFIVKRNLLENQIIRFLSMKAIILCLLTLSINLWHINLKIKD